MKGRGETAFRELESAALEEVSKGDASVISLGGGALLRPANRSCAESAGIVVVLEADLETLKNTTSSSASDLRPLLAGDLVGRLDKLMEQRTSHYNSFSLRVANSTYSPQVTSRKIQMY